MENLDKNWYVEIGGTVYEATTETVDQWIWDGTVLSEHRVSRGGQRWLEAGKVPRFAGHFAPHAETRTEVSVLLGTASNREKERAAVVSQTAVTQPFGVKLMGGSAVALVLALLAGYLWAYQFTAPKDLAVINNSPEMQALQSRYDAEKAEIDEIRASLMAKPAPAAPTNWRGPKYDEAAEEGRTFHKTAAPAPARSSGMVPPILAELDKKLAALDEKFDVDKKKVVADARGADSRSKFYQAFVLLFLGLAGLNLTRLSFAPKK